jgi:hypothetical protein
MTYRTAPWLVRAYLRATGFWAITMPWRVVYVLGDHMGDEALLRHEAAHLKQIDRYGPWGFSFRYVWGLIRHGYWNHPMEIEAREAEHGKQD